jgi:MbtH protein
MERKTSSYVVINHEEQYAIWPSDRRLPSGWRDTGKNGSKDVCLDYIEEVWTDMRPIDRLRIREGKLPR